MALKIPVGGDSLYCYADLATDRPEDRIDCDVVQVRAAFDHSIAPKPFIDRWYAGFSHTTSSERSRVGWDTGQSSPRGECLALWLASVYCPVQKGTDTGLYH